MLKVRFGERSFLFTGDALAASNENLLEKNIEADVLKIPHHGSKENTSSELLEKVNPSMAVISVGVGNIYKHPDKQVLDQLQNKNIKTYRTDIDNSIIMTCYGNTIDVDFQDTRFYQKV